MTELSVAHFTLAKPSARTWRGKRLTWMALVSVTLHCSCSREGGQPSGDGDGGHSGIAGSDSVGGETSMQILPKDAEILGSCTVRSDVCELYFRTPEVLISEDSAYEECRNIEDDVSWNEDWWSAGEACPEDGIESVCRYAYRADFHYSSERLPVSERKSICSSNGGTFYEF